MIFFGASKVGVKLTGGVLFSILASLLGFPTDPAKDSDQCSSMIVLGACCTADFSRKVLNTHVEPAKAAKYLELLRGVLVAGTLAPGDASKLAGRLSFSVTVTGNRVGRAYIKPFYAQMHAPLPGNDLSPWLRACRRVVLPNTCPTRRRLSVVAVGKTVHALCHGVTRQELPDG